MTRAQVWVRKACSLAVHVLFVGFKQSLNIHFESELCGQKWWWYFVGYIYTYTFKTCCYFTRLSLRYYYNLFSIFWISVHFCIFLFCILHFNFNFTKSFCNFVVFLSFLLVIVIFRKMSRFYSFLFYFSFSYYSIWFYIFGSYLLHICCLMNCSVFYCLTVLITDANPLNIIHLKYRYTESSVILVSQFVNILN